MSYDPLTDQTWLILDDALQLPFDPNDPNVDLSQQYQPSDFAIKMTFPAGEGVADAVRLKQVRHHFEPPEPVVDQGSGSSETDVPFTGWDDPDSPPFFIDSATCIASADQ